jgi:hypothetical protein
MNVSNGSQADSGKLSAGAPAFARVLPESRYPLSADAVEKVGFSQERMVS